MTSPFKFLDAYDRGDKATFFGRTEEVEQLHQLVFKTDLLLVYGASGTGKTSLVQCGLANRFKPSDWFELFVRRKDNINTSLDREIRRRAKTPIGDHAKVAEALRSLYLDHLRPLYLIFDQFEELFVLGSAEEQRIFIVTIAALIEKAVVCKIVIVMREEFIAMLYDFEKAVPQLFDKRFRVEPMNRQHVTEVVTGTTKAFGIELEDGEATARQIIENVSDRHTGVQLSYLQVYLDKLYRDAATAREGQGASGAPIVFSERLVRETGALEDVLADFLEEQTTAIQGELKAKDPKVRTDAVQLVLEEFTTLEGTKQPMTRAELAEKVQGLASILDPCLAALAKSRVVRQVEDVFELAHDALARRIADNRSAERKTLLKVQKLVKDRYSGYEQTKTFLSKEELGFAKPHLAKLSLSADETAFVKKSVTKVQATQRAWIAGTAASVLFLLAVLAFVNRERGKAEDTIADARAVVGFVSRIQAALEPITGTGDVRRELLDSAGRLARRLGLGVAGVAAEPSTDFWGNLQRGDIARRGQDLARARSRYEAARAVAERQAAFDPSNVVWQRNLAISYQSLGDVETDADDYQKAGAAHGKALEIAERLAKSDPGNPQAQRDLSLAHATLGDVAKSGGEPAKARARYLQALAVAEHLADATPGDAERQRDLFSRYKSLGDLELTDDRRAARGWYQKALTIAERLADPDDRAAQNDLSGLLTTLGNLEMDDGDRAAARAQYTRALEHDESVAADPQNSLMISYNGLGDLELADGKLATARGWYEKGRAIAEHLTRVVPDRPGVQRDLFVSYFKLGALEQADGKRAAAHAWYSTALPIAEALAKAEPSNPDRESDLTDIRTTIAGLGR
jgi:tetratricopeptide (TPR) repeat protein